MASIGASSSYPTDNNDNNDNNLKRFYEARAISFGIFVATLMLFFLPMFIWKAVGAMRIRRLIRGWDRADRASKPPNAFVPVWAVQPPTVFKSNCVSRQAYVW